MAYGFEYELQVCAEDVRKSMVLAQKVEHSIIETTKKPNRQTRSCLDRNTVVHLIINQY